MRTISIAFVFAGWAGVAVAEDCAELNTVEYLENTPWEQVLDCVESDPKAFQARNQQGYNLLMTAVGASIHPMELDDLISLVPKDQLVDVAWAEDDSGWSLGAIAAFEASDPGVFAILSRYGLGLAAGISGDDRTGWAGRTPLHMAVERDDPTLFVAGLLAMGSVIAVDAQGATPFHVAMEKGSIGSEVLLLTEGKWPVIYRRRFASVEPSDNKDCSNFLTSAFFETATKADVVACLTDDNQLVAVDSNGDSLLHLAAAYSEDEWILDHILVFADEPADLLSKKNSAGMTPLHLAAEKGAYADNLLHLLAWGADPDVLVGEETRIFGKNRGLSTLHIVSSRDDDERLARILILLAFGADTMVQDVGSDADGKPTQGGRTALHRALLSPDPVVLATLLEGQLQQESIGGTIVRGFIGRDVKQILDNAGRTALHFAASRQSDWHTLRILLAYGFSVDATDEEGRTPLMYAAQNFTDSENFLYLLDESEKPCGVSNSGATVEALLRTNEALMKNGVEDMSGRTLSPLAQLKQRCP